MNFFAATAPYVPNPIAFQFSDTFQVTWYGIFIFIGFAIAIVAATLKLKFWYKVSYDPFFYYCILGIPASILGARLWSFIIGDASVGANSNFFVAFWDFASGGLAIQGGITAAVIVAMIWFPIVLKKPKYQVKTKLNEEFHVKQVSMWVYADAIIPCVLLGQIIGRWGNFFNQEVFGAVVENPEVTLAWLRDFLPDVFYGMFIGNRNNEFHQPLFLYEAFFNTISFLIIYFGIELIKYRKAGDLAASYFLFYGIVRLAMEPLRDANFFFVTSIVTSVLFIVGGILTVVLNHTFFLKLREYKVLTYLDFLLKTFWARVKNTFSGSKNQQKENLKNTNKVQSPKNARELSPFILFSNSKYIKGSSELLYYNGY